MFMIEKRIQIQIQTYLGSIIDGSQGGYWELTLVHDWQLLPKKLNKLIIKNNTLTMKLIIDCS